MIEIEFCANGVPPSLRTHNRFVPYRLVQKEGSKPGKVPQRFTPGGLVNTDVTNPDGWVDWNTVKATISSGACARFGWAFGNNSSGVVGIDLDDCRDPESGAVDDWAMQIVHALSSFTEISPSGTGLHIWLILDGPSGLLGAAGKRAFCGPDGKHIEIFARTLWLTLTGLRPPDCDWNELRKISAVEFDQALAEFCVDKSPTRVANKLALQATSRVVPIALVTEAIRHVPSDDYDVWIRVGLALKNEYGDDGFEIWDDWSSASEKYDPTVTAEKWQSFRPAEPVQVGAATILWMARRAGFIVPRRPRWIRQLRQGPRGPIADEANIVICLELDPFLQDLLCFDQFSQRLLCLRPVTASDETSIQMQFPRAWKDSDTVDVQTYLQTHLFPLIGRERVDAAIRLFGEKCRGFHPLQDELSAYSWDGVSRVDRWLETYAGAHGLGQDIEYVRAVGRSWLVSGVARALSPGSQVDHVLVLEGPQGCGKTSALRILGGRYFSDSLPHDLSHKDARDHLRGVWIVELAELTQLKKSEMEFVKSFISRREERFRPAYGRHEVHYPRHCIFAGTTNESQHLIDLTGNRRFWSVSVKDINLEALARDREKLWAEAVALYRQGEAWHLDQSLGEKARIEADGRVMSDPWLQRVDEALNEHPLALHDELLPSQILLAIAPHEQAQTPQNARRVASLLRQLGWIAGKRTKKGQLFVRPASSSNPGEGEDPCWQL